MLGDDGGDTRRDGVIECLAWPCNATAIEVFRLCTIELAASFGGVLWLDITAVELRAALALRRVPRAAWPDVADDVRFMGREVANERNRRADRDAKRKRG